MNRYIFVSDEGYTYQPESDSVEPDCENLQVLGFANGENEESALNNLLRENKDLLKTNFNKLICYKIDREYKEKEILLSKFRK